MAGLVIEFTEQKRKTFAKFVGITHWICILPSFVCLLLALYIQIVIEDKISFIEDYNGAILPGFLVFSGFFGLFAHILCGKVAYSNRLPEKREKWMVYLLPAVIATAVIFLAEFITGIMCFAHIQNLEESFDAGIKLAMATYKDDMTTKEEMDVLQMTYECCGSKSYNDWFSIAWIHPDYMDSVISKLGITNSKPVISDNVPFSCCSPHVLRPCIRHHVHGNGVHFNYDYREATTLHAAGCTDKLMAFYEHSVLLVAGALVMSLSFIQLWLTICIRFLQTSITSVMSADDQEGPSTGYLFAAPQTTSGFDTTVTSTEEEALLDTTTEVFSIDDDEFDEERYVDMDEAGSEPLYENEAGAQPFYEDEAGAEPLYENLGAFELGDELNEEPIHDVGYEEPIHDVGYEEPIQDEGNEEPIYDEADEEHIYNEGDVEEYLASKFAHSREKFEHISESGYDMIPAYMGAPAPPQAPPPPPLSNINFNRSRPSLTKIRSNYGSYMAMNMSNSSLAPVRHSSAEKVPKRHRKHYKGLQVKRRLLSNPPLNTSSPQDTYIINMAESRSPQRKRSSSRRRHTDPERRRLLGTSFPHVSPKAFHRSPVQMKHSHGPIYSSCLNKHTSPHISPRRMSPNRRVPGESPVILTPGLGKRRSPKRSRSPLRRVSPQKTSFRSGVSYECNHAYD